MNQHHYVAIMAGGIGSRFWPMSRTAYPKQFLDILNTGRSLLQSTYDRFLSFIPNENIYIVTAQEYVDLVQEQLPGLPAANILGEPARRNTAPCIAYISKKLYQADPAANLIVAPSDHLIEDHVTFAATCRQALDFTAEHDAFVTLGIQPTHPNTGYGYIQHGPASATPGVHRVRRFTEKPDRATALSFLDQGSYLWNSGIFIWKARDILAAFRRFQPALHRAFQSVCEDLNTPRESAAIQGIYPACESISIDYAILEKAQNVYVIPAKFSWSDLGTWNSAWENMGKDGDRNAVSGSNTLVVDSNGCVVHSTDERLVLVGGVEDMIIVNTPDALLICKKENEQQIKEYLAQVHRAKGALYL